MELTKFIARCLLPLELPGEELNYLAQATVQAMEQRLGELTAGIAAAEEQVELLQRRYGMNYSEFKELYLQDPKGKEADYVTWAFWEKILSNRGVLIAQFKELMSTRTN